MAMLNNQRVTWISPQHDYQNQWDIPQDEAPVFSPGVPQSKLVNQDNLSFYRYNIV